MSHDAIKWSMKQRGLNPAEKAVLNSLAYHADDNGECWPSYRLIGQEAGVSRRSAIAIVKRLLEKSFIFCKKRYANIDDERRNQTSNLFKLNMKLTTNVIHPSEKISPPSEVGDIPPSEVGDIPPSEVASPPSEAGFTRVVKQLHQGSEAASPKQVIEQVIEERDPQLAPVEQPKKTTEQISINGRIKFSMTLTWEPEQKIFPAYCARSGVDPKSIMPAELEEFRRYWAGEHTMLTQGQWENKLVASLKRTRSLNRTAPLEPVELITEAEQTKRDELEALKAEEFQLSQEAAHMQKMLYMTPEGLQEPLSKQLFDLNARLMGVQGKLKQLTVPT